MPEGLALAEQSLYFTQRRRAYQAAPPRANVPAATAAAMTERMLAQGPGGFSLPS